METQSVWLGEYRRSNVRVCKTDRAEIDVDPSKPGRMILHYCDADGTPIRPLLKNVELRRALDRQGTPDVSADGKKVAFDAWSTVDPTWNNGQIVVCDIDGSNAHVISDGFMPSFSPDGKRMAISRMPKYTKADKVKGESIWIVNTDGSMKRMIADHGAWAARWSSDGKSLVFHGGVDERGKKVPFTCLRLYDLETQKITNVFSPEDSPFKKQGFHFEWAKNKRTVAFSGIKKGEKNYVTATIDVDEGLDSLQLFEKPPIAHRLCYDFHPDGQSLLTTGYDNGRTVPVSLELTDEGVARVLPNVPANIRVRDTCYTPDGNHIIAALAWFGPAVAPENNTSYDITKLHQCFADLDNAKRPTEKGWTGFPKAVLGSWKVTNAIKGGEVSSEIIQADLILTINPEPSAFWVIRSEDGDINFSQQYKIKPDGKIILEVEKGRSSVEKILGRYLQSENKLWIATNDDPNNKTYPPDATGDNPQEGVTYLTLKKVTQPLTPKLSDESDPTVGEKLDPINPKAVVKYLKFVEAEEMAKKLNDLGIFANQVTFDARTNSLILIGDVKFIADIKKIADELDQLGDVQSIVVRTYPLTHTKAEDMAKRLRSLDIASLEVVPDKKTNSLVLKGNLTTVVSVRRLLSELDRRPNGEAQLLPDTSMQEVNYRGVCVRDEDDRPIKDALVRLFLYQKSDSRFVLAKVARTDEQGRFSIRGSVPLAFDLTASRIAISSPGRATSVMFYQETRETPPIIKMVAPASITGHITDSNSKPVDGATVILGHLPGVWQARTDSDGRFEILDVPPAEKLNWDRVNILMAVHPDLETLTTTTIKSVPTDVKIQLRNIPVVPSPLARAAQDALTFERGAPAVITPPAENLFFDKVDELQGLWDLDHLPDDKGIEYFAADYRVTRTNVIGAKIGDVKSADFGDEGEFEKHEKIRWHLPTRRGYIEDDQYSRRKQYHFDGERHLEVIHYENRLEAVIADERSERYDWVGLLYCDYVLRPFRGLHDENLPEPNISLRELLQGHEKRYGVITDRQFRIVEDSENLLRIDVVQSNWGNLDPGTTYEVTLDKGMNYAIVSIIQRSNLKEDNRAGVKFQLPTFEGKVERKTFFTDHVQFGDHWIPKRMVIFDDHEGRADEEGDTVDKKDDPYRYAGVQKAEYITSFLSINQEEDMIELPIPADAEVVDKRKEQREAEADDDERVKLAPLLSKENEARGKAAPLLTTVEEVETHLRKVFEERKLLTNADVEFRLISDGDYSYNRRYHVWLNGENRRADSKGVSNNGRSDQTQILTPRYSFFEDRIDGGPQYSARDSKDANKPVGWSGVSCVPDLRKFGLIAWNVESIDSHPWGKNLLNKVRHDVRVETGQHEGHPITIVKSVNKYDNEHGKLEGRNEYWLSPAHGNLPIYLETRTTLPDAEKRVVTTKQHVQWKQFDSVWFPQKIEYIYQMTGKQDSRMTLEVTAARFNQNPFPEVFDPLNATK